MEETERTAARSPEQSAPNETVQSPSEEENYYGNTPRMRGNEETACGITGSIPTQRPASAPRDPYGTTGSIRTQHPAGVPRDPYGTTGSIRTQRPAGAPRDPYGTTGSIRTQRPAGVPRDPYGTTGSIRTQRPAGAPRDPYGTTGSIRTQRPSRNPDELDPNETGSLKINDPRRYEKPEDRSEEPLFDHTGEEEAKVSGLAAGLASIPPKKLAVGGIVIASLLVAVILLVVLIPRGPKTEVVAATPTPEATETPVSTPVTTPQPAPATTQHPVSTPLQFGMKSPVVADIQERLIELGYMDIPVVDGVEQVTTSYGRTTKGAVQTFQMQNGLSADGWCGEATYDLLMSDQAKPFTVSHGDSGPMVKKLQNRLKQLGFIKGSVQSDRCGPTTVDAIKAFQAANGLNADGKAGAKTLEILYSDAALDSNGRATPMTKDTSASTTEVAVPDEVEVETSDGITLYDDNEIEIDPDAEG